MKVFALNWNSDDSVEAVFDSLDVKNKEEIDLDYHEVIELGRKILDSEKARTNITLLPKSDGYVMCVENKEA
jgi:hypothetical protein